MILQRAQAFAFSVAMFGGSQGLPHVPGQTDDGSTHLCHGRKRPWAWQGLPSQGLPNGTPEDFGSRWGPLVMSARLPRIHRGSLAQGANSAGIDLGVTAGSSQF